MAIPWMSNRQPPALTGTSNRRIIPVRGLFETEIREAGTGEPLLVLHDLAARNPWAPFLDRLAAHYRMVAPMHPGFGGSRGIEHIDDPVDVAIYYNDLLDTLGIDSACVLGHDLGAMFAAELAAISPARVRKLVLVAPIGLPADGVDIADLFAIDPAQVPPLLWHNPTSQLARDYDAMPSDPAEQQEATIQRARAFASASRFTWPFPERGLRKRIHRITAPTLIICGESDGFVPPALSRPFTTAIPGSQFVTIPAAAHFPMLEQPDDFVSTVTGFLGQ